MDIILLSITLLLLFAILLSYTPFNSIIFEKKKILTTKKKKSNREVRIDNENIIPSQKIVPKFRAAKPDNITKLSDSVPWYPEGKPKKEQKYKIYVHQNNLPIEDKKYNQNFEEKKNKISENKPSNIKNIKIIKMNN
uniref:Uncharacterized protein n=1 Tax=Strongyloides stercoralis TaxID=6248 RepID=A0A0K0DT94_STRER